MAAARSHTRQRLDEVPTAKLQEDLGEETSWGGGTVVWVHVRLASPSVGNVVGTLPTYAMSDSSQTRDGLRFVFWVCGLPPPVGDVVCDS